jgi:predicted permease
MIYLFALILIGYLLTKLKAIPEGSAKALSRLESMLFIPALVLSTFIKNFTADKIETYGKLLLLSSVLTAILIPLAVIISKFIYKGDAYLSKIATYGLSFANFGYMGNAIMSSVFPEIFTEYTVFVMPLWIMIYLWGVPTLLIAGAGGDDGKKKSFYERIKPLINPMFIAMLIGMIIGIAGLTKFIPTSIMSVVEVSGSCMSPIAMLLTGMIVAASDLKALLTKWKTYLLSVIRLVIIPLTFILIFSFIPKNGFVNETFLTCAMCSISMPLGLNTIVVPGGYGKDTTDAAGMALISHTLSVATIPLIFLLFNSLVL